MRRTTGAGNDGFEAAIARRSCVFEQQVRCAVCRDHANLVRNPQVGQRISRSLRGELDARIQLLTRTRAKLDECIGCGCVSLTRCQLYNKDDRAAAGGTGPRYVLG